MKPKSMPRNLSDFESPEQILQLIQNERIRWLVATLATGDENLSGDPRPAWAIRAAVEFWRCCQDLPRTKEAASENYRLGLLVGVVGRLYPSSVKMEPELLALVSPEILIPLVHTEFSKAPASDAAEFYAGLSEALKREHFAPATPYIIYFMFALMWPEIADLRNVNQIHNWLEKNLGPNITGTRDRIAKICQKVKLPLMDKGGRPKRKPRK